MSHEKGTLELIRNTMERAAKALESLVEDPRFLEAYHAEEKRESYFLDIVLMGTEGMVVTPARVAWESKLLVPGWTPDEQSDFAKSDRVRHAWLVLHAPDQGAKPTWYPIVETSNIFFTLREESDWEALGAETSRLERCRAEAEGEIVAPVDLESWLRQATASELLMLADTQWGRRGVLEGARESLAAHYTGPEGEVFRIDEGDRQGSRVTIESDPDQILEWLYRHRPAMFATVVLVPYTQEFYPAPICVQMDDWLNRAIQVAAPGMNIPDEDPRGINTIARELLLQMPGEGEREAIEKRDGGSKGNVTVLHKWKG